MTKRAYGLLGVLIGLVIFAPQSCQAAATMPTTVRLGNVCLGYVLVRSGDDILLRCPVRGNRWVTQMIFKRICPLDPPTRIYTNRGEFALVCNHDKNPYRYGYSEPREWQSFTLPNPPKR